MSKEYKCGTCGEIILGLGKYEIHYLNCKVPTIKSYKATLIKELEKKDVRKACRKWAKDKYDKTPLEWHVCKFSFDAGFNLAYELIKQT